MQVTNLAVRLLVASGKFCREGRGGGGSRVIRTRMIVLDSWTLIYPSYFNRDVLFFNSTNNFSLIKKFFYCIYATVGTNDS
jgi:hypothetical protein